MSLSNLFYINVKRIEYPSLNTRTKWNRCRNAFETEVCFQMKLNSKRLTKSGYIMYTIIRRISTSIVGG